MRLGTLILPVFPMSIWYHVSSIHLSCVHVMSLTELFPCHPINVTPSQRCHSNSHSRHLLMSEGLSKANHNISGGTWVFSLTGNSLSDTTATTMLLKAFLPLSPWKSWAVPPEAYPLSTNNSCIAHVSFPLPYTAFSYGSSKMPLLNTTFTSSTSYKDGPCYGSQAPSKHPQHKV